MRVLFLSVLIVFHVFAECVHEAKMSADQILSIKENNQQVFVHVGNAIYKPLSEIKKLDEKKIYDVQFSHGVKSLKGYDDVYLKYYTYDRVNSFLSSNQQLFDSFGYKIEVVGQSIEGRNLYAVFPKDVSATKKTMIMFGRHHGDEGTANWIIEGFVKKLFHDDNKNWFDEYQILLYPMVNPDGAENHSRYNKNGRDLNRSWSLQASREYDEIVFIHNHIRSFWNKISQNIFIALDMHGSFTEDFIYRVDTRFRDRSFYDKQQQFISELAPLDPWQAGNFQVSNGDPGMARIVFVKHFGINALTHETPRDIKINNNNGRSIQTLEDQGEAVYTVIKSLY